MSSKANLPILIFAITLKVTVSIPRAVRAQTSRRSRAPESSTVARDETSMFSESRIKVDHSIRGPAAMRKTNISTLQGKHHRDYIAFAVSNGYQAAVDKNILSETPSLAMSFSRQKSMIMSRQSLNGGQFAHRRSPVECWK